MEMKKKTDHLTIGKRIGLFFRLYGMKLLAVTTIICGIFGSYIYYGYQEQIADGLRLVMITLFSTFKLYMASPTVSLLEETNILYEIARLLAPIYTAAAIVQTMKKASLNAFNRIRHISFGKIYVYGLNDTSMAFMDNVKSEAGTKKLIYLNDIKNGNKMTDSERLNLLMKGIVIQEGNFTHGSTKEERRIQYKKLKIKNDDVFVLMNEDDSQNFIFLVELKEYLIDTKKQQGIKCRVMCKEFGVRNLIADIAKECHEHIDINTFDIAEIAINDMLQNPEHLLYDAKRNKEHFDSHILILGFGRIGEEVLVQAANNCVTSADNQITFDVFDKNMNDRKEIFLRRFAPDEIVIMNDAENNISTVYVGNIDEGASKLCIRFHMSDIRTRNFELELKKIASSITYAAICFEDPELSLMSMLTVRRYLNVRVPLAVRMDMDSKIIQYIKKSNNGYRNIFPFCISREIFSYESIVGEKLDKLSKAANQHYEEYASKIYNYNLDKDNWLKLSMFLKNSNRMQVAHGITKSQLLQTQYYHEVAKKLEKDKSKKLDSDGSKDQSKDYLENQGSVIVTELKELIKKQDLLFDYMHENRKLFEFAQVEHRRWSYYHLFNGYRHVSKEEFEALLGEYRQNRIQAENEVINWKSECREVYKVHNLLLPWKELIYNEKEGAPFTTIYDLIPLLMEAEKFKP